MHIFQQSNKITFYIIYSKWNSQQQHFKQQVKITKVAVAGRWGNIFKLLSHNFLFRWGRK